MRKIIITYGLIAGAIIATLMFGIITLIKDHGLVSMAVTYLAMLVAFSFVYVGVKKYRETELGGVIKFGRAFMVGFGIAAIGSLIYVLAWEVYMYFTNYTFMAEYSASYIEGLRAKGTAAAEIAKAQAEMAEMSESYKNPIFRMLMTSAEIGPVGLLVSLIVAWVVRMPKRRGA
ncbi:MAG: hypothetical protein FD163_2395 [Hyphomonadaceae bacterium]|nr:MAG: hypothetical protein FD128_260 [Hyphomonadaceae bacterium]KAF0183278.1 MAG: hypothetical protein FD163_2395 [Hyphomonadaceae bacterium]